MALRIKGRVVDGPKMTFIVIPRQDGDIPFTFVSIQNDDDFDKLCPMPKPPRTHKTGVGVVENTEDENFKKKLQAHGSLRADWFFLNSIRPSEIEWEKVKLNEPETWKLWREELTEAGFSVAERDAIYKAFLETNTLTQAMVDEARLRFLASQALAQLDAASSQVSEPVNTESGSPANDGASAPQG